MSHAPSIVRHASFQNVLYGTSLVGLLAGCGKATSCDEGNVYDGEECVNDTWQWGDRYSFHDVLDTCASLAALNTSTFCEGLEGKSGYNTCVSFYDTFKDNLETTAASFEGSQADVYVANSGFTYETSYGTYGGKIPTITFNQDNLLLSCESYRITDGCQDDQVTPFLSALCYSDTFEQGGFSGSCVSNHLPSLTLLVNSSQCPGLPYGVAIEGASYFNTETLTSDLVTLQNGFSRDLKNIVCASDDYLDYPELCR